MRLSIVAVAIITGAFSYVTALAAVRPSDDDMRRALSNSRTVVGEILHVDGNALEIRALFAPEVTENRKLDIYRVNIRIVQWGLAQSPEWQAEWSRHISSRLEGREVLCTPVEESWRPSVKTIARDLEDARQEALLGGRISAAERLKPLAEAAQEAAVNAGDGEMSSEIDTVAIVLEWERSLHAPDRDTSRIIRRECRLDADSSPYEAPTTTLGIKLIEQGYFEFDQLATAGIDIGTAEEADSDRWVVRRKKHYLKAEEIARTSNRGLWNKRLAEAAAAKRAADSEQRARDAEQKADVRAERATLKAQEDGQRAMYVAVGVSMIALLGGITTTFLGDILRRRDRRTEGEEKAARLQGALVAELRALRRDANGWINQQAPMVKAICNGPPDDEVTIYAWPVLKTPVFDAHTDELAVLPEEFIDHIVYICSDAARLSWMSQTATKMHRADIASTLQTYIDSLTDLINDINKVDQVVH